MIDRVAADLGAPLVEVPVGFKWFVPGLIDGSFGFGGEESAGASFLRRDGSVVDHRQGRHHPGAARLGDPGRDRPVPERALRRADRAARRPGVRAHRRPRRPASRRPSSAALSPDDVTADDAGRRADHGQAHRGPGQRRDDRRPQGDHRDAPGSPPARRAPRTSTRSTPSRSRAPTTSPRCRPRPGRSSSAALRRLTPHRADQISDPCNRPM